MAHIESLEVEPSNQLLYWRQRRNLSLAVLSMRIEAHGNQFASPKTINRWERGESRVPEWAIPELAKILRITEEELLYGPKEANPSLSANVSAAYTGLDLEIADRIVELGYSSWMASRPEEARGAVNSILPWLEAMQRRINRSTQASEGKRLLARGYELLGALALDRLENDEAVAQFRRALTTSEEIHDASLIAAHMTQLGDVYRRKGDSQTALALMEEALSRSRKTGQATRGYVLEMIAYTYADAGNEVAFARHIHEATDLLASSGEAQGTIQREFVPFEVLEISGKATRDFGHPIQALEYLAHAERALASRPTMPRWHAVLTISKAQALCDAGELQAGVDLAIHGLVLAHSCQSPRQMNRVRKLMRKLDASKMVDSPALVPLRETVRDIYTGNRSPLAWHPSHPM